MSENTGDLLAKAFDGLKHPRNTAAFEKADGQPEKKPTDIGRRAIKGAKWGAGLAGGVAVAQSAAAHVGLKSLTGHGVPAVVHAAHIGGSVGKGALVGAAIAGGLAALSSGDRKVSKVDYDAIASDEALDAIEAGDEELMAVLGKAIATPQGRIEVEHVSRDLERLGKAWAHPETHHDADAILQGWADGEDAGELRKALSAAWLSRARSAIAPAVKAEGAVKPAPKKKNVPPPTPGAAKTAHDLPGKGWSPD